MTITVPSILPRNTLTPAGLQHKFVQGRISPEPMIPFLPGVSFSGLGACIAPVGIPNEPMVPLLPGINLSGLGDCLEWDESGNCIADDGSGDGGGPSGGSCPGTPGCPGYVPPDIYTDPIYTPTLQGWAGSGVLVPDGSGDVVMPDPSGHGYIEISPSGMIAHVSTPFPPTPGSGSTTITQSQAAAYASIINSLTQAGVRIAAITSLPAGASLLPNGTIVGAGQTYNPGSGGINPTLGSLLSSPVLLLGIAAIGIGLVVSR